MKMHSSTGPMFTLAIVVFLMISGAMVFTGCKQKPEARPGEKILPDTTMIAVMTDMYLVEGVMIQLEYIQQKEQGSAVPYYNAIYQKYGVDRESFIKSLEYYTEDPEHLDRIYDRVIQNLGKKQLELRKEEEKAE
jgi:hypothetical protein